MRTSYVLLAIFFIVLQGCSTQRCDKIKAYQQTVPSEPLAIPGDLTEPPLRGQSPDVDPDAPIRRSDGGCLELPPPFEPEESKT